jgi:hypothetical protein
LGLATSCPLSVGDEARADRRMTIHDAAAEAIAQWPALASAPQPEPFAMFGREPPRSFYRCRGIDRYEFDPVGAMAEFAEQGLYKVTGAEDRLVGPFDLLGTCCWPLLRAGDRVYVDPTKAPDDGALVLLKLGDDHMRSIISRGLAIVPNFREAYGGSAMSNLCVKLFWRYSGRAMAYERHGCELVAGDVQLLGVVGRVEREGRPVYGGNL